MNFSAVAVVFEIVLERQIIIIVPFLLDYIYYQLISFSLRVPFAQVVVISLDSAQGRGK